MSEQTANLCTTDACESLRQRLAKYEDAEGNPIAQPAVVVLPDPKKEIVAWEGGNYDEGHADGWNDALDEVARLNSFPVSAGDDRKLSDIGNELHNLSCHVVHHNEGWANQLGTLASELWNWQARAALTASAPNHGAQVREVNYKRKFECLVEHAKRQDQVISELRYDENIRRFYDDGAVWFWAGNETDNLETLACPVVINAGDLRALLAAAPSAGSQGGDVKSRESQLLETFVKLTDFLGIDLEAARSAPGKPSDVFIQAIISGGYKK